MKYLAILALILVAGCGADGEPVKPDVGVKTTIGVGSKSGPRVRNEVSVGVSF